MRWVIGPLAMRAAPIYAVRMTTKSDTPEMRIMQAAIADEVRALIARRRISGSDIARRMNVEQTWLSRRITGQVPWSVPELMLVLGIMNEDIAKVLAAGQVALDEARKTNPCLSCSATLGGESLADWSQLGLDLALDANLTAA